MAAAVVLLPRAASAAPGGALVVTTLRTPPVTAIGRYATADCVIKNIGGRTAAVKAVAVALIGAGGAETNFAVSPPHPFLTEGLDAGQTYTFRQFQQMNAAGDFLCVVRAEDAQGHWTDLTFPNGRLATARLHVVPAAAIPQVSYQVTDPQARHVYAPDQQIRVQVLPVQTGGPDLSGDVASVQITPEAKPFSISDADAATALLHGGDFQADFYNAPNDKKALDITVTFARPLTLGTWSLGGQNLNGLYGLKTCAAQAVRADGTVADLPSVILHDGDHWTALSAAPRPFRDVTALRLRVRTAYKIDLQSLNVEGADAGEDGAVVRAQWQDGFGHPLTFTQTLPLFQASTVASPPFLPTGYVGLALTATIPGLPPARSEYGFAVLPPPSGLYDERLGMVHMDIAEPNLGVGWIKTTATNYFNDTTFQLDVAGWRKAIADRTARGLREVPLLADSDWASDSTKPIGAAQLQRIHDKMTQFFQATPNTNTWELGLEENLGYRNHRSDWPYYWSNLDAKAQAVRQAAADAHVSATLIYQIAERDPQTVTEFCRSAAQRQFDVLALHPYIWPDFPAPEQWMPPYLAQVQSAMAASGAEKPIWFTEIGAPVDGNPGGFFGYPTPGYFVRGLTRAEHADYLVKCHLLALSLGVAKVFWYTYQDHGSDPEYAEDHFGMIDVNGYPLPSYVAYSVMVREIGGKPFASARLFPGGVRAYRFHGSGVDTWAVWTYPAVSKSVPLASLGLRRSQIVSVTDLLGRNISLSTASLPLTGSPVYIWTTKNEKPDYYSVPVIDAH